jgi:chemotaxis response regulator CheB
VSGRYRGPGKEIREIVVKLREQGWRVPPPMRGGHLKCYAPDGETIVTIPASPGGGRAMQNIKAELKRAGAVL